MAKRYGRNQKRKAREEIARLTEDKNAHFARARRAEYSLECCEEKAFKKFILQHGMIEAAIQRIAYELGRALAPELEKHARDILNAGRDRRPIIDFSLVMSPTTMTYTVIEGAIPSLHYRIHAL